MVQTNTGLLSIQEFSPKTFFQGHGNTMPTFGITSVASKFFNHILDKAKHLGVTVYVPDFKARVLRCHSGYATIMLKYRLLYLFIFLSFAQQQFNRCALQQ